jgi:two-component system sensor histidine kinase DctS
VRDDGCGVPEQARASLFEPLVTTKPLGVGLGLSTARNLLENQRGTIRYRPGAAGGSVFVIHLPLAQR